MVRGAVQNRFGGEQLEFKVSRVELMDDIREKYFKSITLKVPLPAISEEMISDLERLIKKSSGKSLLKFDVFDPETKQIVNLFSRNTRIEITNELIAYFEKNEELAFKIN
jgi:DNA polymerase-3 subunit alpha